MDSDISDFKRKLVLTINNVRERVSKFVELSILSAKDLERRVKKLSKQQKDYLFQGLVVSALVLPMLSAPFISGGNAVKADSMGKLGTGVSAETINSKRHVASGPSRGVARTAVAKSVPQQQVQAPPAQPAPPAAPPVDPNRPPTLTQNTQNINPVLLHRFDAFRSFIYVRYHVVLEIKSGWRSYQEQAKLFATLPRGRANPPGVSQHEFGQAIDYTNFSPEYNKYLGMFGLKAPYQGKENWHIEIVEPH